MLKPVKRDNKKPYSSPIITVYGTVQELTQKVSTTEQQRRWALSAREDARLTEPRPQSVSEVIRRGRSDDLPRRFVRATNQKKPERSFRNFFSEPVDFGL